MILIFQTCLVLKIKPNVLGVVSYLALNKCENCKFCKDDDDCVNKIENKRPPQYILYDVKMTETFRLN